MRALNLWRVGSGDFLAMAADPEWPEFPSAQLVAALVTAAERSAPGRAVRMLSWTAGVAASARRSVRIAVEELAAGPSGDLTLRLTVAQRDSARGPRRLHGSAVVMLVPRNAKSEADAPSAAGGVRASRAAGCGLALLAVEEIRAAGIVPGGLPALLADEQPETPLDPTTRRALLAYLGAATTMPPGCTAYPAESVQARSVGVLASTIAFVGEGGGAIGRVGPRGPAGPTHGHAVTEIRTPSGRPILQTSQAVRH
ncbi:hypothetical protein [Cryptosporangium phraense]|uniref:Thioesterase family protein n=1 Tax=Cryptosporangium phraense TaxID=2593070 RepID=A0A545B082_9ACTN|nr:hypothetical protein [Cryptosporangium phraense]TQS46964.1 hypothetical protein FL583_01465 [Cryptosporangium phraense]